MYDVNNGEKRIKATHKNNCSVIVFHTNIIHIDNIHSHNNN